MSQLFREDNIKSIERKIVIVSFVVTGFVFLVLARLFYFQVIRGSFYAQLAEQISVREEKLPARRGLILDRNGAVLADKRPYFEIVATPQYLKDKEKVFTSLSKLIPVSKNELNSAYDKAKGAPPFIPVVLVADAPYDWVARVREFERPDYEGESEYLLSGISVRANPLRKYLFPELFSHTLGYLREIDKDLLKKKQEEHPDAYLSGDWIGSSGVEENYDFDLRGIDGIKARVVDARGKEISENQDVLALMERGSRAPVDGNHLVTTLDYDAQKAAAEALGDRKGGVVALDPNSGEVIVLYSSPGYDANRITGKIDKPYWQKINLDPQKFLFNRAVQGTYPPGSTYKMITALAGLDTGKITTQSHFNCGGGMQFGNRFFQCWNKGGHGVVDVVRSITQSCDVFFYNVGLKVGVDTLYHYAHLLGLGVKTGIDIPFEKAGLIPSTDWKMNRYKQKWIESETLSISIGQGYDLVTPLQNARMIAMLANGGRMITPHLGKEILSPDKKRLSMISFPVGEPQISEENLKSIREGLIAVVQGAGTAGRLKTSLYKIAGKTGTAQVTGYESKIQMKDHALFVGYAPYDNPKIAVSVIVENGGHGGSDAAPVAQAVIDTYLGKIMPIEK